MVDRQETVTRIASEWDIKDKPVADLSLFAVLSAPPNFLSTVFAVPHVPHSLGQCETTLPGMPVVHVNKF